MDQSNHPLQEVSRLRLLAAALELQHLTGTAANLVPIPGGDRVIAIGAPAQVSALQQIGPAPADLIRLGAQMASTLYNLKQKGDVPLRAYDREKLGELQEEWDAARREYREAAQQQFADQVNSEGGHHD